MDESVIWLYTLSTCDTCERAEKLLQRAGQPYETVAVDLLEEEQKAAIVEMLRQVNPRLSFPTLVAGETVIVGYREAAILEALEKPPGRLKRWIRKRFGK